MADSQRTLHERYELRAEVGRGGMGRVWKAHDIRLNRTVAVKEILLGPGLDEDDRTRMAARARREAQATAMGQHPNIVTVHDILEDDGRPWIVMEFLEGESLHRIVRDQGPLEPERAAAWGLSLLDALGTAHAQGITHRDVKPENVMVTDSGRVVLTDFGIATIADTAAVTQTAGVMGSPAYLAPERLASSPASPAGDLWSLGATLYQATTGVSPFQREGIPATLHAVLNAEPPGVLPGPLGGAIQGMLVKDPARRLDEAGSRSLMEAAARGSEHGGDNGSRPATGPQTGTTTLGAGTPPTGNRPPHPYGTHPQQVGHPQAAPPFSAPTQVSDAGTMPVTPQGSRRLSWPVVVLTLGLASLVVAASLVVFNPWSDEQGVVSAGTGTSEEEAGEEPTEAEEPAASPSTPVVETDEEGDPTAAGMTWTQDPEGFSMLVPDGWVRRVEGDSVFYDSHTDNSYLQVDRTAHPTDDQYQHVLDQEDVSGGDERFPGYERVRVEDVTGTTDFHSAADWEFIWSQNGVPRHLMARNITVTSGDYYTVLFAAEENRWTQQGDLRENAITSFDPL
ncbi:serine/threonine-protein kinase [Nocardiopsis sp. NPDC055551]|uniref:serine/threonine-protein kinase n=1 Tax=Nocardiopsis sp. NPDC006832 TaxID=3157188 RepID=UPI0033DA9B45